MHEGPSYIRNYYIPDDQGYRPNMFTSNGNTRNFFFEDILTLQLVWRTGFNLMFSGMLLEPGFYLDGEFGIRLENIIRVTNATLDNNFQNQGFLGFEDLTFVPYQHKLIKLELLTPQEVFSS